MITITQHIPTFVDMGDEAPPTAEVSSREELMAVPWVKRWDDGWHRDGFTNIHWYISPLAREYEPPLGYARIEGMEDLLAKIPRPSGAHLLIDGIDPRRHCRTWWVVAYLNEVVDWFSEWPEPSSEEIQALSKR